MKKTYCDFCGEAEKLDKFEKLTYTDDYYGKSEFDICASCLKKIKALKYEKQ